MSNQITTPSKIQQDFLDWYSSEKAKGLADIKFYPGNISQATVDDVLKEALGAVHAYSDGQCIDLSNM